MKEFGQILKELRKSKGISQETLGSIVHVSRSSIAKYENGLGLPSDEVVDALCNYFEVNREFLFPKQDVEEVILKKNRIINKQKIRNRIISLCLLVVIVISTIVIMSILTDKNNYTRLEDAKVSIDIDNKNEYQKDIILFDYEGGYVYQRIEIHKIEFTKSTNLYLLRVHNTYVNGNTGYYNGYERYDKNQYTEKVYMSINFPTSYNNLRPVTSWPQKHSDNFSFTSQLTNDEIILNGKIDLFDGASIQRYKEKINFYYDCEITDYLLDYEYNNILRKCKIKNGYYFSDWEFEMLNDRSKSLTFPIYASYLFEAEENDEINFEIDTKMVNTTMSISQKKIFELTL